MRDEIQVGLSSGKDVLPVSLRTEAARCCALRGEKKKKKRPSCNKSRVFDVEMFVGAGAEGVVQPMQTPACLSVCSSCRIRQEDFVEAWMRSNVRLETGGRGWEGTQAELLPPADSVPSMHLIWFELISLFFHMFIFHFIEEPGACLWRHTQTVPPLRCQSASASGSIWVLFICASTGGSTLPLHRRTHIPSNSKFL